MLAEIISFGGRWKNFRAIVKERHRTAWKGDEPVRLAKEEKASILISIKVKERDNRETIVENGKTVKNEHFGKYVYETVDTIEVFEATGAEVKEAVLRGIAAAAKK